MSSQIQSVFKTILALSMLTPLATLHAEDVCPKGRNPAVFLPHARDTLQRGVDELVIVALGSSSTQGAMASNEGSSFPALLQADLSAAFPTAHVAVLNRGIGGQDAAEEVLRLDADAIAVKPAIVIWQVGANGAMRNSDPEVFRKLVAAGIERMQAAGIDVLLMDNQRSPKILAAPEHLVIDQTLETLAKQYRISDFSRGSLMDTWMLNGAPYERFVAADGLHHNDLGYRCLAQALSQSIADGLMGRPDNSFADARP